MAQAARSNGVQVVIFALRSFATEEIAQLSDEVFWLELGQLGKAIELMKEHDVRSVAMAGRVPHQSILQYRHFDARAVKLLARSLNKKADSLLGAVASEFEREGITVLDSSLFLKSLMPASGLLTPRRPLTPEEQENVDFAYPIAKAIAGQDVGQTIVVKDGIVVAVEALEGTDKCIRRAGELAGRGCIVVKVSKPGQDMRFDIPVIGPATIESMRAAGCTALAVSARECLVFHREEVVGMAEKNSIAMVAVG
jgi:DUF1009 family protein